MGWLNQIAIEPGVEPFKYCFAIKLALPALAALPLLPYP